VLIEADDGGGDCRSGVRASKRWTITETDGEREWDKWCCDGTTTMMAFDVVLSKIDLD